MMPVAIFFLKQKMTFAKNIHSQSDLELESGEFHIGGWSFFFGGGDGELSIQI